MSRLSLLLLGIGLLHPPRALAQDAIAGKAVFGSQCSICHSTQAGRNMTGPSLFGIVGRTSGQVEGFHYSAANKAAAMTWDAATLDSYLEHPRKSIPGTTMGFPGLKDGQKRADLIAYLSTLH